jgi:hypothetical protein
VVASWSPKNAPAALDVTQIVAQTVTKPVKNFGISFEGEKKIAIPAPSPVKPRSGFQQLHVSCVSMHEKQTMQ